MVKKSKITKFFLFIFANVMLITILYIVPLSFVGDGKFSICLYKNLTGKNCFNCGMTRAFLSLIHFRFDDAINYNKNVVLIFPLTMFVYCNAWLKYILK